MPVILLLVFLILPAAVIGCAHDPAAAKPPHYEGPIIDTHVHVERQARSITPGRDATFPNVDRILSEAHLGGAALVTIARKGQMDVTRAQNDELAAALRKEPARFFAFGSVHPDDGDAALEELDRMSRASRATATAPSPVVATTLRSKPAAAMGPPTAARGRTTSIAGCGFGIAFMVVPPRSGYAGRPDGRAL
jgi:hypothetical protein